jgi:hypothetical protein
MDELITLAKFIADESRGYNNLAMFSILSFNNSPEGTMWAFKSKWSYYTHQRNHCTRE